MWDTIKYLYEEYYAAGGQFIDHTANYILVIGTVYAFLKLAYLPVIFPLRKLFARQGLTFWQAFRLVFTCKKDTYEKVRLYMELACIENHNPHQSKSWWKKQRRRFKEVLRESHNNPSHAQIKIDTCYDLLSEEVKENISRYFQFLNGSEAMSEAKEKNEARHRNIFRKYSKAISMRFDKWWYRHYLYRYNVKNEESPGFLSKLVIHEGYLAPMAVITGLNDRFEQNWKRILKKYNTTLEGNDGQTILPEELYFSFNWLMWGPSYRVNYKEEDKACIMLYGYGDEANSVNVMSKTSKVLIQKGRTEKEDLNLLNDDPGKFGKYGIITGRLIDTLRLCQLNKDNIDSQSLPFFERISQDHLTMPFVLQLEAFETTDLSKKKNIPFFSAYLWIMFRTETANQVFSPAQSITFFEHSNLPDPDNYQFLTECLIEKAFNYFKKISTNKALCERKYRYSLAMNGYIEELFVRRLHSYLNTGDSFAKWLKSNLIRESDVTISIVLDAFDRYFQESDIRELQNTDKDRKKLGEFYSCCYYPAFGHEPTHETLDQMLSKLSEHTPAFSLFGEFDNNKAIKGIVSIYYIPDEECGLIKLLMPDENDAGSEKTLIEKACWWIVQKSHCSKVHQLNFILLQLPVWNKDANARNKLYKEMGFFPVVGEIPGNPPGTWFSYNISGIDPDLIIGYLRSRSI